MKYFVILILVNACLNQNNRLNQNTDLNDPKADTIIPVISTAFMDSIYPIIFEAAYFPETKVKQGVMEYNFHINDIGKIKIESGRIIACDPIVMQDGIPFTNKFPIGQFPVQLAMAKRDNDERVAFSRILFSDKAVNKWECALQPGQKKIDLTDTTIYCYGVDAGSAIFIDEYANKSFNPSEWDLVFIKKAEQNGYVGFVHNFQHHNLATFSTGYGDGCYATYIGFDGEGEVCRLITDFGLVEWWTIDKKD